MTAVTATPVPSQHERAAESTGMPTPVGDGMNPFNRWTFLRCSPILVGSALRGVRPCGSGSGRSGEGLVGCNNLLAQLDDVIAHPEDKNGMGSLGKESPKSSCTTSWVGHRCR